MDYILKAGTWPLLLTPSISSLGTGSEVYAFQAELGKMFSIASASLSELIWGFSNLKR